MGDMGEMGDWAIALPPILKWLRIGEKEPSEEKILKRDRTAPYS
jgi:hypothetical protein